ncbi:hypothetical protein V5O48_016517 [Marasmius crinis-equi]|uniref:Uncharacterized protein n=1 Tax=Marasmius crinis-equi TaxID=585013 RepID=A0ABR3ERJ3_9AGAR
MAPRTKAKPQALQPVPTRRSQRNQPHQPLDGPDAAVLDVPAVTFEELRRRNNRKGAPNSQNAPTSLQPQDDHDLSTAAKVASEIQLHRQDIIPATASVNISSPMHREGDYDATDEASDSSVISITHHNGYQHPRNNSQLEYPDEDEYQYTDDENQYTNENEQEQPDDDSDWFPSHNTRSPATGLISDYEDFEKDLQELDNQLSSDSDMQTPCAIRRKPPQCSTQTYDEENSLSYYNDSPIHPSIITPGRGAPRDAPRDTRRADPSAARNSHAARVGHSVAGTLRDYVRDEVLPRSTQASDVEFSPNEYDSSPVRPRAAPRGTRRADPSAARNSHAARVGHSVAGTLRDHVRGEVLPRPTQASDVEISSNEYNSPLIQPRATARHAAPKNVRRGATSAMRGGAPTAQGRPPATQVGAGATHVPVGRSGTTRARGGTSANKSRGGAPTAQGRPAHDGVAARRGNREAQPAPALQSAAVQNVPARAAPALQALMSGRNLSPSVRRIVGSRLAGEDPRKSADVHKFLVEYRREETGNLRRLCKWCVELKAAGHETPNFGDYSMKTSTGVIRDHFLANHPEAWIKECDSLNLTMKGKQADAAEKYREEHNMQLTKAPRQMFIGRPSMT